MKFDQKNILTEFLTNFSATKSGKCGHKNREKYFDQNFQKSVTNLVTNYDPLCRSQFSVKKINEICEKYYGHNFQKSVTNCDQQCISHNFRSKKSMKTVKKYYGHNFKRSDINFVTNCDQLCVGHNFRSKNQ